MGSCIIFCTLCCIYVQACAKHTKHICISMIRFLYDIDKVIHYNSNKRKKTTNQLHKYRINTHLKKQSFPR